MTAIRYFKISFVQIYNFFVVLNSYNFKIVDSSKTICYDIYDIYDIYVIILIKDGNHYEL